MPAITITTSGANATRVAAAIQESLGLDAPATAQEIKNYIISDLKQLVRSSERRVAVDAVVDGTDIVAT